MLARADALLLAATAAQKILEPRPTLPPILEVFVFGSTLHNETVRDVDVGVLIAAPRTREQDTLKVGPRLEEVASELTRGALLHTTMILVDVLWDKRVQRYYAEHAVGPKFVGTILADHLRWDRAVAGLRYSGVEYLLDTYKPDRNHVLFQDLIERQTQAARS